MAGLAANVFAIDVYVWALHKIGFADSPGLAVPRRFCKRELGSDFVKILAGLRERIAIHPNAISGANAVNKCATDKRDATDKTNRATDSILIGIGANAGFVFDESRSLTGLDCGAFHHFGIVADVHALSFPLSLELVNGFSFAWPTFFRRPNSRPEHVPAFPVPRSREPSLLQEDARERVAGMVGDGIARTLASAHGGVEKRQDVGEGGHFRLVIARMISNATCGTMALPSPRKRCVRWGIP